MNLVDLSRAISHALRHEPWIYELEPDEAGWVPAEELLSALREMRPQWRDLTEADVAAMIEASDKQRHELAEGKIRALYGHSIPGKLRKEPGEPPARLYHGTAPETAETILREGLAPMSRQYVHLSVDTETAAQVGRRKAHEPVILVIEANAAHAAGIGFYQGNDKVWLSDAIPATFLAEAAASA